MNGTDDIDRIIKAGKAIEALQQVQLDRARAENIELRKQIKDLWEALANERQAHYETMRREQRLTPGRAFDLSDRDE